MWLQDIMNLLNSNVNDIGPSINKLCNNFPKYTCKLDYYNKKFNSSIVFYFEKSIAPNLGIIEFESGRIVRINKILII